MEPEARFKIDELAEATDLSRRTIHHYIAEGMIPRARGGSGPAAYYDEEHYLRLRMLARLKGMGLSMSTIRDSMDDLSLEEMREVLELPEDMDYRAIWAHVAMQRSGTPESFRVEEAELKESLGAAQWSGPPPEASAPRWRLGRRKRARAKTISGSPADADVEMPHDTPDLFSSPGAIRRDPAFVDRLAQESVDAMKSIESRISHDRERSFEEYEDKHHLAHMMSPAAYQAFARDPDEAPLHPEMDSQPWRRVRVSNDLEISFRPSSDPLTRKKLRHLLDFVHRLFRLEISTDERSLDTETDPTRHPRTPGERPQDREEET